MKAIINGRKYDTETASELATARNRNFQWGDFQAWEETLYVKRTGEFFLYGKGGAATKYATPVGHHSSASGDSIVPLTEEDAKRWAERHLRAETYEEIFGECEE